MPRVLVSSLRFTSMLANRTMNLEHFSAETHTNVNLEILTRRDCEIDFDDLLTIAKRFNRPWPYLLIDEPEPKVKHRSDNRTLLNQQLPLSSDLLDQIRTAEAIIDSAARLIPQRVYEIPAEPITLDTCPASTAKLIRSLLGVTFDDQLASKSDYNDLRIWSAALENRGIYVTMRRLNDPTVRAFSLASDSKAIVVADTQDIPYARIFSILHEYVHIVLRSTGICDLNDHTLVERYCNAVAANTLMPDALLKDLLPSRAWGVDVLEDEGVISEMSRRFGVSKHAFLIRLRDGGYLQQSDFDLLDERRRNRHVERESNGGTYYTTAISRVGRLWAHDVVRALEVGRLNRQEAGALLGIPEHNVGGFRRELVKQDYR